MSNGRMAVREVADRLGVSVPRVYQLIKTGKLRAEKEDGRVLVDCESVDCLVERRSREAEAVELARQKGLVMIRELAERLGEQYHTLYRRAVRRGVLVLEAGRAWVRGQDVAEVVRGSRPRK